MKTLSVAIIFTLSMMVSFSQVPDTLMKQDIDVQVDEAIKKKGKQLIVSDGNIRLFANVKNGKVVSFYANDQTGKELKVSRSKKVTPGQPRCMVCVVGGDGQIVCWWIDCSKLPKPTKVEG